MVSFVLPPSNVVHSHMHELTMILYAYTYGISDTIVSLQFAVNAQEGSLSLNSKHDCPCIILLILYCYCLFANSCFKIQIILLLMQISHFHQCWLFVLMTVKIQVCPFLVCTLNFASELSFAVFMCISIFISRVLVHLFFIFYFHLWCNWLEGCCTQFHLCIWTKWSF